jgi:hypothetical protein
MGSEVEGRQEEARKLLDSGWNVVLWKDGLGQYSALAYRAGESADKAVKAWREYFGDSTDPDDMVFGGPHRYCGCGLSVADALEAVTEKVLFRRLPGEKGEVQDDG